MIRKVEISHFPGNSNPLEIHVLVDHVYSNWDDVKYEHTKIRGYTGNFYWAQKKEQIFILYDRQIPQIDKEERSIKLLDGSIIKSTDFWPSRIEIFNVVKTIKGVRVKITSDTNNFLGNRSLKDACVSIDNLKSYVNFSPKIISDYELGFEVRKKKNKLRLSSKNLKFFLPSG